MATNNQFPQRVFSSARQRFVELMREVGYGRIYQLPIQDGDPILSPRPRIALSHKFGGEHGRTSKTGELALKQAHVDLFRLFDEIGSGTIDELTITNGLPLHAERTG